MATFWRFFSSHYSGKVLWWIASLSTWAQCYQCTSIKMWISIKFLKSKSEYGSQIGSLFENECAFKFRDPKYYLSKHLAEQYKMWNESPLSKKELSNILLVTKSNIVNIDNCLSRNVQDSLIAEQNYLTCYRAIL